MERNCRLPRARAIYRANISGKPKPKHSDGLYQIEISTEGKCIAAAAGARVYH